MQLWLNLLRVTLLLCSEMIPALSSSVEQCQTHCCQIESGCCASVFVQTGAAPAAEGQLAALLPRHARWQALLD